MTKLYSRTLHIFRRDLRLNDNTALAEALRTSDAVMCCFIMDPRQVTADNPYRSTNALQFMIESLQEVDAALREHGSKLYVLYGKSEDVLEQLLQTLPLDAVSFNADYTPFSTHRDKLLTKICQDAGRDCLIGHDALLNEPGTVVTDQGAPYGVFTPFMRKSRTIEVPLPQRMPGSHYWHGTLPPELPLLDLSHEGTDRGVILTAYNPHILVHGGRSKSRAILSRIEAFSEYKKTRDFPELPTTHLSAYNKFGTHSIREVYHAICNALGQDSTLINELYWRDFFYHVAWHTPRVFGHAYHEEYDHLEWDTSKRLFEAWCTGTTGYPIIDAGMRELTTTGYMHNRVRMAVASFLTKDLHLHWRWGERFFAQHLTDYDPCVNNGSWQWAASTGCDAQPYFRIFNPWSQQIKFDPECRYIKQWVPELRRYTPDQIHNLVKKSLPGYPSPIVDHALERAEALRRYKAIKK